MTSYETRKLHLSVPLELYEHIRENKLFKEIDGIVVALLVEKFKL
jgi:Mor family transcriptional regulator